MKVEKRAEIITKWIDDYCKNESFNPKSLVVGISGGIDSSVVSTLCAKTGRKTIVLTMPIKQIKSQHDLSLTHAKCCLLYTSPSPRDGLLSRMPSSA